ncbi:recombinase family protein [Sphingobium subterraneum]|uniref:DNA invertase Pin-like site-specific DNA recombinase n=1 Tax=Sphingobium subterraneum TaxID=627688 RepID=A0A841J1Q1_9SPHN|nr:DNA invertase Pin-like site-specific DNA recombinase [Sphingobium subterraneum]
MAERKRCAVYTRKSTEEGLEQAFNSLDAQREACCAYIMSQAHEGWELVPEQYDDGGWSGGSMDRPALRQLLADVEAGKVDVIIVYKVDRLTRALTDFARIVDIFDKAGASFVSVTQAFNTTTSMGRLTLNVLLSFAQFEREVTGERIRDKVAASKRKGMWMGGPVPIGYRLDNRKLVIDNQEAATVQLIFERYVALRSIAALVDDLHTREIRTKQRTYKDGRIIGGISFTKGPLAQLLKNPIYLGKVRHRDVLYDGEHAAIIDEALWNKAQTIARDNGRDHKLGRKARNPSLLAGIITDPEGRPMTPSHTRREGRQYRYYISRLAPGEDRQSAWRVPAGEIERIVIGTIVSSLRDHAMTADSKADTLVADVARRTDLAEDLASYPITERRSALLEMHVRVQLGGECITLSLGSDQGRQFTIPARLVRRGSDVRLALPPGGEKTREADPVLLKLIAHARAAQHMVESGIPHPSVAHYGKRHRWQLLRIAWLAPDIQTSIIEGRQPPHLTGRRLLRATNIPFDWAGQRRVLGFD